MWKRPLEDFLITRLLNSQKFHDIVGGVHQIVSGLRNGQLPRRVGPTNKDVGPRPRGFLDYFKEEIKDQLKGKPRDKY